jgi:folate-binding Fe-S cluster repair protein YgfZ
VGQEVTARSHHRGQIKKQIQLISGEGNLSKGQEILHNNIKVGFITSVEKNFALALIDNDFNHNLTCAGQEVKIL